MVHVKICGITNEEDYRLSVEAGADLVGFVLVPGVTRAVTREQVRDILKSSKAGRVTTVGLFVDAALETVALAADECGFDMIQLQGSEDPDYVSQLRHIIQRPVKIIKAFKVGAKILPIGTSGPEEYEQADFFVFDTYHPDSAGGTGEGFDWEVLRRSKKNFGKPFFIAGGLTPGNVTEAVRQLDPYGVDVSSGVESQVKVKDEKKIKEFVENAKAQDA